MNKILKVGLCTIILGIPTPVSGQQASKNKLEIVTEKNAYISPDGNYSLKHDPKKYGLSGPTHEAYPMGGYKDTYQSWPNQKLVIECIEKSGDLNKLYDEYAEFYTRSVFETITKYLRPGRKIYPVPMSPHQHIIVDNHPAIRSSVEFIVTDSEGKKVSAPQHYLQITLAQENTTVYGFIFFNRIPSGDEMNADVIYNVLDSFKTLK